MAKSRMVNTRFWADSWVRKLNALDRYLFLYFLTNEHTNICGIYELPIGTIAYETGLDERDLLKTMIPRLKPKMYYVDEWVYLVNFPKHQAENESVRKGIINAQNEVPIKIKEKISLILEKMDSLSQAVTRPEILNLTKLNLTKLNLAGESDVDTSPTPKEKTLYFFKGVKDFLDKVESFEAEAIRTLLKKMSFEQGIESVTRKRAFWDEVVKFSNYWQEKDQLGKKERWQMQKTFEVERRLQTWLTRAGQWTKQGLENNKGRGVA